MYPSYPASPSTRVFRFRLIVPLAVSLVALAALAPQPAGARGRSGADLAPQIKPVEAAPSPLVLIVSLRKQRVSVFGNRGHIVDSPISSGQPGLDTPTGVFSVIEKDIDHESNIYSGAPMPFMERITWSGVAMHAGNLPGYPASHGCIRLPYAFSKQLYGMTKLGTRVVVTREDVAPTPIAHDRLFKVPLSAPDDATPTVASVGNQVASLVAIAPAAAAVPAGTESAIPMTAKAKARWDEIVKLGDAVKSAEKARVAAMDRVRAANRAVETARTAARGFKDQLEAGRREADSLKRAKQWAEMQLADVMRRAQSARTASALTAASVAEDAAEGKLLELVQKYETALEKLPALKTELQPKDDAVVAAETARRALDDDIRAANQALKAAQAALFLAKRDDARLSKPMSVFISRKTQRVYVRQGFEPVLEMPVVIEQPDQPLGTHIFTAMDYQGGQGSIDWHVVSMPDRDGRKLQPVVRSAGAALDRIKLPREALDVIGEGVKPGASLLISDEATNREFGKGTDFIVTTR